MRNNNILLIHCSDRIGLVHDITGVLKKNKLNIEINDEFVDQLGARFFMRTEFSGAYDSGALYDDLSSMLPEDAKITLTGKRKKNIIVLATKEHHCLGDILLRHMFGELNANILAVVSNHELLRDLTMKMDLPFHYVSHENLERGVHEEKVMKVLEQYNPEYIVLAKYMRILTPVFTEKYSQKIINIHHSFLPAFVGASPYRQAFERGVKIIGATAHFVNHELDEGPIICQSVINIDHRFTAEDMARAGHDVEKMVLSRALKLVFEDRVMVNGNKTVIFS